MRDRHQRLVCIIGTDGSGKTTLSDSYVDALRARGQRAERVWLGSENYLMAPVRRLLRAVWSRGPRRPSDAGSSGSSRPDYRAEIARKNALAQRYRWAVPLYVAVLWLDYRLQVAVKRWTHRNSDVIVADRYLFDVAVNLGLALGWSPEKVVAFARRRLAGMQLPAFRVFLRVEPEVSLSRKDDIPDIEYLRLRFRHYEAIARAFGFTERDGTLPIETNRDWLLAEAAAEAQRPYVLYVHANNHDVGGADKMLALMARHMRDHGRPEGGARVAVTLRLETGVLAEHAANGVPVILHPFLRPQTSGGVAGLVTLVLRLPGSLWFFWRLFGRERPDIVHVNDLYDILPVLVARLRGIPAVWHVRMIKSHPLTRRVFATALERLSAISISVSDAVRRQYFPNASTASRHRALVIHDLGNAALVAGEPAPAAPDTSVAPSLAQIDPREGRRVVVMVGRIEPWKGQDVFVRAVAALPDPLRKAHAFVLVGGGVANKGDFLARVMADAAQAGITCLGPRDDVPAILRRADISVHASTQPDPFPGVVIESLLAGAATIATAAGGVVEMIRPGQDGLLVPPGDADALAAALTELLTNPVPPRDRFGREGRARALSLVDAAVVDARMAEAYRTLLLPVPEAPAAAIRSGEHKRK